jgi:flagellar biosynthetic protein FliP
MIGLLALADPQSITLSTEASPSMVQLVVIFGLMSLLPALVLTTTCFTRFVVVFSFLKTGLGTQGAPPNQVLVGLALFMTAFVMAPVGAEMYEQAGGPYMNGEIDEGEAYERAEPIARKWLLPRTRPEDLAVFYEYSDAERPETADDVPLRIAVPAFVLSELRTAFQMGLLVLLPFLVIDLVVATVLSSLGMVMLPPTLVSLPVKLLVFVMADGWNVLVMSLLRGVAT